MIGYVVNYQHWFTWYRRVQHFHLGLHTTIILIIHSTTMVLLLLLPMFIPIEPLWVVCVQVLGWTRCNEQH